MRNALRRRTWFRLGSPASATRLRRRWLNPGLMTLSRAAPVRTLCVDLPPGGSTDRRVFLSRPPGRASSPARWPRFSARRTYVVSDLNQPMLDGAAPGRAYGRSSGDRRTLCSCRSKTAASTRFSVSSARCSSGRIAAIGKRDACSSGWFLFNVWDRIEDNEFARVVTEAVGAIFPSDPPRFLVRTPHGYHVSGGEGRAGAFLDEAVQSRQQSGIVGLPIEIVLPGALAEDEPHSRDGPLRSAAALEFPIASNSLSAFLAPRSR